MHSKSPPFGRTRPVASLREMEQPSSVDFALPARRVREVLWECDASSHRFL